MERADLILCSCLSGLTLDRKQFKQEHNTLLQWAVYAVLESIPSRRRGIKTIWFKELTVFFVFLLRFDACTRAFTRISNAFNSSNCRSVSPDDQMRPVKVERREVNGGSCGGCSAHISADHRSEKSPSQPQPSVTQRRPSGRRRRRRESPATGRRKPGDQSHTRVALASDRLGPPRLASPRLPVPCPASVIYHLTRRLLPRGEPPGPGRNVRSESSHL